MKFFGIELKYNGFDIFHKGNMGSGSGLDADKLDNQEGSYYLDFTNATNKPTTIEGYGVTNGVVKTYTMATGTYCYEQVYGYTNSGTVTGTVKITLPKTWSNTMLHITLKGYDYSSKGAYEIMLGGYNYSTGWINTSAMVFGNTPFSSIRFAHDGTNCCILLGTTSTSTLYPKIYIEKVIASYNNATGWGTGWSISIITDESTLTNIVATTINLGTNSDLLDGQHGSYYLNYNNLSNKPSIPTKTSDLTNDSGFTSNALQQIISTTEPSGHITGRVWIQTL